MGIILQTPEGTYLIPRSDLLQVKTLPDAQVTRGCGINRAGGAAVWTCSITTMGTMAGRECYHCKQWVEEGEEHDCWTTTETALPPDRPVDSQDAWGRLPATTVSFREHPIYAPHQSLM